VRDCCAEQPLTQLAAQFGGGVHLDRTVVAACQLDFLRDAPPARQLAIAASVFVRIKTQPMTVEIVMTESIRAVSAFDRQTGLHQNRKCGRV